MKDLCWRPLASADLPQLEGLFELSPHGAPALRELRDHLLEGRLSVERVGWLVAEAEAQVQALATTQHCLEAVLAPGLSPQCLVPLWATLGPELRRAQLAEAWWPLLGPVLAEAWGGPPQRLPLLPCWAEAEALATAPEPEGFGWAEAEDLPQLLELDRAHDQAFFEGQPVQDEAQRAGLMAWFVQEQRVLVRRVEGRVVFQTQLSSAWQGGAELHGFGTHPEHRGQGHAQAGLVALGHRAAARGWGALTTQLPTSRPGLRALFASAGFRFQDATWLQAIAPAQA